MNGIETAQNMVLKQASRVREIVENSDYSKCPVGGQKEVNLFMVDGITAILEQGAIQRGKNVFAGVIGGGIGAAAGTAFFVLSKLFNWGF